MVWALLEQFVDICCKRWKRSNGPHLPVLREPSALVVQNPLLLSFEGPWRACSLRWIYIVPHTAVTATAHSHTTISPQQQQEQTAGCESCLAATAASNRANASIADKRMIATSARLTFDEALTQYIGEFGRGQKQIVAIASLLAIPNGLIFLLWVMVTIDPIKNHHWQCVDPADAACQAVYAAPSSQAFCQLHRDAWHWTNEDSLVSRFNLICTESWKIQLANSLMFIGCFFGSGLFGALSDRIGRKIPLFIATAIAAAATLVSVAAPSYWFIAAMRLVAGMGAAGQVQGVVLLCMETTGRSFRGIAAVPQVVMFCVGEYILVALAVSVPNWRSLTLAAGAICAAALLLYPVVPESARWLMSQQGKEEKAVQILRSISIRNGSSMPEQHLLMSGSSSSKRVRSSSSMKMPVIGRPQQQQRSKSTPVLRYSVRSDQTDAVSGDSDPQTSKQRGDAAAAAAAAADLGSSSSSGAPSCDEAAGSSGSSNSSADSSNNVFVEATNTSAVHNTQSHGSTGNCKAATDSKGVDNKSPAAATAAAQPVGLVQLLRQPALAAMSAVMVLTWFANFVTFYTISLGTGGLPGSIYTTFALNVTGQTVATLLAGFLVDKLGRHNVISGSLLIGGIACLTCANITNRTAQIVLATIGQFGSTASLAVTPTYTAELYPTPIRSTALGICNKACRLGSISAPFMIMLGVSAGVGSAIFLPYMICGSVCFAAGVLVLLMPETLGKDMPETMEDLQQLKTVFAAKPWREGGCWQTTAFLFRIRAKSRGDNEALESQSSCQSCAKDVESQQVPAGRQRPVDKNNGVAVFSMGMCGDVASPVDDVQE